MLLPQFTFSVLSFLSPCCVLIFALIPSAPFFKSSKQYFFIQYQDEFLIRHIVSLRILLSSSVGKILSFIIFNLKIGVLLKNYYITCPCLQTNIKTLNKYKDNSHLQVYMYSYYTETMGQGKSSHFKADILNILNFSTLSLSLSLSPLSAHFLILKQLLRVTSCFIFFWYSFILVFP